MCQVQYSANYLIPILKFDSGFKVLRMPVEDNFQNAKDGIYDRISQSQL